MKQDSIIFHSLLTIVSLFLLARGIVSGESYLLAGAFGYFLVWFVPARRYPGCGLGLSVLYAVNGLHHGENAVAMTLACGFSLILWDLCNLEHLLAQYCADEENSRALCRMRYRALGFAMSISSLLIFTANQFSLKLPFFVVFALVALAVYCLSRILARFKQAV